ncbi:MAG: DNA polymerase III subunit delta', partial [Alphaproteobacteria bacterium RIFOXYD12_FULL_60_8]
MSEDTPWPSPRLNGHLFGHETAEAQFLDAWTSQRLAHAWLITGPRGVGKATLAYRIARFVLSGGGEGGGLFGGPPDSLAMDGDHPVFRRIATGGLTDLRVVERGYSDDKQTKLRSEIVVDDVREIGSFLSLTPAEGGWRVVLVDAADEMNRNAANALLKVLEEPPARALLLLVCHAPGRLLPTIRSRCRSLVLSPLDDRAVEDLLTRYRPDMSAEDRRVLTTLSEGSPGRALALEEQGGLELYRAMLGLLSGLPRLDVPALHNFAETVGKG